MAENKIITPILICFFTLYFCVSCEQNLDNSINQNTSCDYCQNSLIFTRIDSLNFEFLHFNSNALNQITSRHASNRDDDTEEMHVDDESVQKIAMADGTGFFAGVCAGGLEGLFLGSVIPGWGSVIGGTVDAIVSGIAGAVLASSVEAKKTEDDDNNGSIIVYETIISLNTVPNEMLFSECCIGSDLGFYHNKCITSIWNQINDSSTEIDEAYVIQKTLACLDSMNVCVPYPDDINVFNEFISIYNNDFYDFSYCHEPILYEIVSEYFAFAEELQDDLLFQYTKEFMELIESSIVDLNEVYIINGTISTYFYSKQLWKVYKIER